MASMFEQSGSGTLFLGGQKISGADIRDQNGMLPLLLLRLLRPPATASPMLTKRTPSPRDPSYRKCRQELVWPERP